MLRSSSKKPIPVLPSKAIASSTSRRQRGCNLPRLRVGEKSQWHLGPGTIEAGAGCAPASCVRKRGYLTSLVRFGAGQMTSPVPSVGSVCAKLGGLLLLLLLLLPLLLLVQLLLH